MNQALTTLNEALNATVPVVHELLTPSLFIIDPQKRVFWLYLLCAVVVTVLAAAMQKRPIVQSLRHLVSSKDWFTASSRVDFQWLFLNHALYTFMVFPLIGGQVALALLINKQLYLFFGEGNFFELSPLVTSLLFTCAFFIVEDFSRFYLHRLYHKHAWLWRFHAIHHSADRLTPVTLYRIHSVEMLMNSLRSLLAAGIVSGIFLYLFEGKIQLVDILGANVFAFLFNIAGANLRHSPIWISFGRLERLFISPAQHQIHHSTNPAHFDKNMGATLALWDRLFGTLLLSKKQKVTHFGLSSEVSSGSMRSQLFGIPQGSSRN